MQTLLPILVIVVFAAAIAVVRARHRRKAQGFESAPRNLRPKPRALQVGAMFVAGSVLGMSAVNTGNWLLGGCAAVMVVSVLYEFMRSPCEGEAVANWVYDRGRCGRCGYDLTYIDEPTSCPECGWVVPPPDVRAQRADWANWWTRWAIDYLDHPWRMLFVMLGAMVVCVAAGVWLAIDGRAWIVIPLAVLGGIFFAINVLRIVQYLRRESRQIGRPSGRRER